MESPTLAHIREYYGRVWNHARSKETWGWGRDQLVALLVAVAIIVLLVRNGSVPPEQQWQYVKPSAVVYLGALAIYALLKLSRIPVTLDQERQAQITRLEIASND